MVVCAVDNVDERDVDWAVRDVVSLASVADTDDARSADILASDVAAAADIARSSFNTLTPSAAPARAREYPWVRRDRPKRRRREAEAAVP